MPKKNRKRRNHEQKILLDADAYLESDEKPFWMLRNPRSNEPVEIKAKPHFVRSHGQTTPPRGYDPDAKLFITSAEVETKAGPVALPFLAKSDLSLQQLKGTMRFQLGLGWREVSDADLKLHRITADSISMMAVRDENIDHVLRKLANADLSSSVLKLETQDE